MSVDRPLSNDPTLPTDQGVARSTRRSAVAPGPSSAGPASPGGSPSPIGRRRSTDGPAVSPASLAFLRALIARRASIDIPVARTTLWVSRLNPVVKANDLGTIDGLVAALQVGDRELEQAVVDAMTTNETMFFRDGPVFEAIVTELLPSLVEQVGRGDRITIWSGASSSGQEIYSLAMLLDLHHPDLVRAGRVRILASDLSSSMVERARSGRYSTLEARRGLTEKHLRTYFERDGDSWVVGPRLQRLVLCRQLNLMEPLDPIPRCDLVLLRNVLIYFSDQDRLDVLRRVKEKVLRPNGALVLGSSELLGTADRYYESERLSNGFCFRPRR